MNLRILAPVAMCAVAVLAGCTSDVGAPGAVVVPQSGAKVGVEVRVLRQGEEVACLCAALADDEKARNTGLSKSGDPSPFDAMVFKWEEPTTPVFWMKETPGPLDAVFVGADGVVGSIQRMDACGAGDCQLYASKEPGTFAVELRNADVAGIRVGDLLLLGEECSR